MPSASPPRSKVGAGPGAGEWGPGEDAVPHQWHPMSSLPLRAQGGDAPRRDALDGDAPNDAQH